MLRCKRIKRFTVKEKDKSGKKSNSLSVNMRKLEEMKEQYWFTFTQLHQYCNKIRRSQSQAYLKDHKSIPIVAHLKYYLHRGPVLTSSTHVLVDH